MSNELTVIEGALDKAQQAILTQSTPAEDVRHRQGRGGRQLAYVDHAYVTRLLNNAFAFNWDFETDEAEVLYIGDRPYEVKCRGKLTIRVGDMAIVKMQYGCQPLEFMKNEPEKPVSLGDAFKGAASDALKKCASLLGIALDLYDSDSDLNRGRAPQQQQVTKAPQAPTVQASKPENGGKATNGGKIATDPMTQFWLAVKQAELSEAEGARILSSVGRDPVKALDALQGISQPIAA